MDRSVRPDVDAVVRVTSDAALSITAHTDRVRLPQCRRGLCLFDDAKPRPERSKDEADVSRTFNHPLEVIDIAVALDTPESNDAPQFLQHLRRHVRRTVLTRRNARA